MDYLTVDASVESLDTWKNSSFLGDDLRISLADKNLLLVPEEVTIDGSKIRCFPQGTQALAEFLREEAPEGLKWDVCIDESDYQEYVRHADVAVIVGVFATLFVAPLCVNLLAEYIKRRCGVGLKDTTVKASLTVKDETSGRSLAFKYDGPAETFEKTMLEGIKANFALPETTALDNRAEQERVLIEAPRNENTDDVR